MDQVTTSLIVKIALRKEKKRCLTKSSREKLWRHRSKLQRTLLLTIPLSTPPTLVKQKAAELEFVAYALKRKCSRGNCCKKKELFIDRKFVRVETDDSFAT